MREKPPNANHPINPNGMPQHIPFPKNRSNDALISQDIPLPKNRNNDALISLSIKSSIDNKTTNCSAIKSPDGSPIAKKAKKEYFKEKIKLIKTEKYI